MKVCVKLFAGAAAAAGQREVEVNLLPHATVGMLRSVLQRDWPVFGQWSACRIAVNQCYVGDEVVLSGDEELAVIPPVSGG